MMWIFTSSGFFSIVIDRDNPKNFLVRARIPGQIENVFKAKSSHTPETDYTYRASIPRDEVTAILTHAVKDIDYPNFKNSIEDDDYHRFCEAIWAVAYQRGEKYRNAGKSQEGKKGRGR